ncbi:hypothetical protein IMSAG025_02185 [Muribaculaceae bacterium]|nr:hypothetical protein IMSAG025_02185 [Muribaculaceae bacterium]
MTVEVFAAGLVKHAQHRVFFAWIEILRHIQDSFRFLAVVCTPFYQLRRSPVIVFHLWVRICKLQCLAKIVAAAKPYIGRLGEIRALPGVDITVKRFTHLRVGMPVKHCQRRLHIFSIDSSRETVVFVGIVKHFKEHLSAAFYKSLFRVCLQITETKVAFASFAAGHALRFPLSLRVYSPDIELVVYKHCLVVCAPAGFAPWFRRHRMVILVIPYKHRHRCCHVHSVSGRDII